MQNSIKKHFESVFHILKEKGGIKIPNSEIIDSWDKILKEWIDDESMTLFARKGSDVKGSTIDNSSGRHIIKTDNTPAHWVFNNMVMKNLFFKKEELQKLLKSNQFPIGLIMKVSEKGILTKSMIADKDTRLNEKGWKLAHIEKIALKRGDNISLEHYKKHHFDFLSLGNMYLINKEYSGLAEVELFNEIVKESK